MFSGSFTHCGLKGGMGGGSSLTDAASFQQITKRCIVRDEIALIKLK